MLLKTWKRWKWSLGHAEKTLFSWLYSQKWLFICENGNVFSWEPALWTHESQDRVMRWRSKKNHCNFHIETAIFEPRHENKSCSACPEDQLKPFKFLKISNFQIFEPFKIFPGSQLLSDFQTFFCFITRPTSGQNLVGTFVRVFISNN